MSLTLTLFVTPTLAQALVNMTGGALDVGSSIDGQEHILLAHEDAMHDPLDADFEAEYSHKDRAVSELSSGVVDGRCHVALYSGQCGLAQGEPGAECI